MTRPVDFLVVGAQKCGTTTVYEDLRAHPRIHIAEKESSVLTGGRPDAEDLRSRYRAALRSAPPEGIRGEVSTTYTMLATHPEVVENARQIPGLRVIYIVRDPLLRTISHHHHDFTLGLVGPDINEAVVQRPELVDHSRYATQLRPWLDLVGPERVQVVRFEDYMADRASGARQLFEHLGADPDDAHPDDVVHNAADTKVVAIGRWRAISTSRLYRRAIRPLIPEAARRRMMKAVLPGAPPRPAGPSDSTLAHLVEQLDDEVDDLASMLGTAPWWNIHETATRLSPTST